VRFWKKKKTDEVLSIAGKSLPLVGVGSPFSAKEDYLEENPIRRRVDI